MARDRMARGRSSSPGRARRAQTDERRHLTLERAIAMQDALIRAFSDPQFQAKLKEAFSEAGNDPLGQIRLRHELCLPVQTPVVQQFGFASVADSIEAFTAELNAEPEIAERRRVIDGLIGVGAEDEAQGRHQMTSVMQVFAAVPSQHQAYFQHSLIAPANGPAEEEQRRSGRSSSLAFQRSFSADGGRKRVKISPSPAPAQRALRRHRSASKTKRPGAIVPFLSRETAIAVQDELIEELEKPLVQKSLWRALNMAGSDESARCRARQAISVPVQLPVVRKFGFLDVGECLLAFTPQLSKDPDVTARMARLEELVNPTQITLRSDQHPWASEEVGIGPMPGQQWRVIGGRKIGGIVPRVGKELNSALLCTRGGKPQLLKPGAVVQELELCGDRLHYKKVSGDGPGFGWVSLESVHGNRLLTRVTETLEVTGNEAYIRDGPSEEYDVVDIAPQGATVEVFKRHDVNGLPAEFAQLTPRQVLALSKVSSLNPNDQAFVELNGAVTALPDKGWTDEDSELEVLPVTVG